MIYIKQKYNSKDLKLMFVVLCWKYTSVMSQRMTPSSWRTHGGLVCGTWQSRPIRAQNASPALDAKSFPCTVMVLIWRGPLSFWALTGT